MDRIEQLMKDIKPSVTVPDRGVLRSEVTSTDPNVVTMPRTAPALREATRTRRTRIAAVAVAGLAAAAVAGAVVVGGNFPTVPGPAQPVPAGPNTTTSGSAPATPTPASPSPSSPAAATPSQSAPPSAGGVACTPANIDQLRNDRQPSILPIPAAEQRYYTVLGCTDGWLAYVISDEGGQALKLDGGNAWFRLAKLQNGRFLWDVRQPWATVFNWEFQTLNNQGLTAQQAMDKEFAEKGIPVTLRQQLVGDGPAAK